MNILDQHFSRHKTLTNAPTARLPAATLAGVGPHATAADSRDPFTHGSTLPSPLKEPRALAGDSDGVVERALSPAFFDGGSRI